MSSPFQFEVLVKGRLLHRQEFEAPIELGRQEKPEEPLYTVQNGKRGARIAIARLSDSSVSRQQARLEPVAEDRVRVFNISSTNVIRLRDGTIAPGASREMFAPCQLNVQDFEVRIESLGTAAVVLHSLGHPTMAPGTGSRGRKPLSGLPIAVERDSESLVEWLQAVSEVLQSATGTDDFFQRAASAVVDLVGLDSGRIVLLEGGEWKTAAEQLGDRAPARAANWRPSRGVLAAVRSDKRTIWRDATTNESAQESLIEVEAVVAAPILDRRREVIGALYGDRLQHGASPLQSRITRAEAMLMETLASGVAAGLARLEQEKKASVAQVQFEQFFSADLARELALNPDLLAGRDAEVSVLFCDIRDFSHVAEKLGATSTMQWINDVLGVLSECILDHQGVLVDYVGDELMAMWGAPTAQPDHAQLACRAALDIWKSLPELNKRWQPRLGELTRVGVGVNTGPARVGNTGSQRKFKYGPLGNTVNLASRVQGATKYLRTGVVVTSATYDHTSGSLPARRLCQARVVNIAEPVTLYELSPQPDEAWIEIRSLYEEALRLFEQQQLSKATAVLGRLLDLCPDDGPAIVLLSRAATHLAQQLASPGSAFDPVWELPGK
jgi:adenylate cyclase